MNAVRTMTSALLTNKEIPMPSITTTTYICDNCRTEIPAGKPVVELGEYGIWLHPHCLDDLSAKEMLQLQGNDKTIVRLVGAPGAIRARRATSIDRYGIVKGGENVDW